MTRNQNALALPAENDSAPPRIGAGELAARIGLLGRGQRLTLTGISAEAVEDILRAMPAPRGALRLATGEAGTAETMVHRLLDDLAQIALNRWPYWYGWDEHAQTALVDHATADSSVSRPWLRAAIRRVEHGRPPRFRKVDHRIEFVQLMRAIDPANPVLIATVDPHHAFRAAPVIHALEWCLGLGASVVVALPEMPPAVRPYDRILYDALQVARETEPAVERFIAPRGRAHHASAIEHRVEAALLRDQELGPLFRCNESVPLGTYGFPRVDLLWREGRVVVELDGPEHQGDPNFANDRHRDYELLVAGYLVLRLTNDQVDTDLQRAIEKIRAVVRLRRQEKRQ